MVDQTFLIEENKARTIRRANRKNASAKKALAFVAAKSFPCSTRAYGRGQIPFFRFRPFRKQPSQRMNKLHGEEKAVVRAERICLEFHVLLREAFVQQDAVRCFRLCDHFRLNRRLVDAFQLAHVHVQPMIGSGKRCFLHVLDVALIPEGGGQPGAFAKCIGSQIIGVRTDQTTERTSGNCRVLRFRHRRIMSVDIWFDLIGKHLNIIVRSTAKQHSARHQRVCRPRRVFIIAVVRRDSDKNQFRQLLCDEQMIEVIKRIQDDISPSCT